MLLMVTTAVASVRSVNFDNLAGESISDVVRLLEKRVILLESHLDWDEALRRQNPALQDLYEKFQATKKLVTT